MLGDGGVEGSDMKRSLKAEGTWRRWCGSVGGALHRRMGRLSFLASEICPFHFCDHFSFSLSILLSVSRFLSLYRCLSSLLY